MTQQILEKLESDIWLFYYFNLIGSVVTLWLEIIICLVFLLPQALPTSVKHVGVERTPDPTRTRQVIGAQNLTQDTRPD